MVRDKSVQRLEIKCVGPRATPDYHLLLHPSAGAAVAAFLTRGEEEDLYEDALDVASNAVVDRLAHRYALTMSAPRAPTRTGSASRMSDSLSVRKSEAVTTSHVRWHIFLLMLLLVSINYIDRPLLSVAMPLISTEFDLDYHRSLCVKFAQRQNKEWHTRTQRALAIFLFRFIG